jgi:hypothetical protein
MSESQDRPRRPGIDGGDRPQRGRGEGRHTAQPAATPPSTGHQPPPNPATPEDEALTLPAGALVALRKSGGLVFRSREIVVYGDGRVGTSAVGGGRAASVGTGRTLGGAEIAALRRAIGQVDFDQLPLTTGQQPPDAFVYELAALAEGMPRTAEVVDGQIPATVAPLIRQLNRLLSSAG